jgi:hypothetical protein
MFNQNIISNKFDLNWSTMFSYNIMVGTICHKLPWFSLPIGFVTNARVSHATPAGTNVNKTYYDPNLQVFVKS